MNLSRLFILRPVATTLLMVAVFLAGAVAYSQLPVAALPQVDYPTIQVRTLYPGASPDVMASSVTSPLERQFGQMPGLTQMTSSSASGSSIITLQFALDLSLDVAEQEVQAAINTAYNLLPTDLPTPPVYSKINPADAPILSLALTSESIPLTEVQDLADTRLAQKISQLSGVGLVNVTGGKRPAVRVDANPTALAAYGLTLEDVRAAIAAANVNEAKGGFDGPRQASIIGANDQLLSSKEYKPLVVAYRNGRSVRLADVATVSDGAEDIRQAAWVGDKPAIILNIQRQPGANVIDVVDRIKTILPKLKAALPESVQVAVLADRTETIRASIEDVQLELFFSVILVVGVIFLFLRDLPATIIPGVAVPLSLVGTFGVMYLLGYSVNNLTLMALTISTGFVVDDAIVMIENVARYVEAGKPPLEAALAGSKQIGFTILSLTVSLVAVAHSAAVHGRRGGAAFPGIRRHPGGDHPHLGGGLPDADADDVRPTARPDDARRREPFLPGDPDGFRSGGRRLRSQPDGRPAPSDGDVAGRCGHHRADRRLVRHRSQGLFSGPGYRHHFRRDRSAGDRLLRRHGRTAKGRGRRLVRRP